MNYTAMNQKYNDCVEQISQILFQAITEREENLVATRLNNQY